MISKRLFNIVKRMLSGECFYTSMSPRMTMAEFKELEKLGFRIQCESPHQTPTFFKILHGTEEENHHKLGEFARKSLEMIRNDKF
jgi:hypothetical protein